MDCGECWARDPTKLWCWKSRPSQWNICKMLSGLIGGLEVSGVFWGLAGTLREWIQCSAGRCNKVTIGREWMHSSPFDRTPRHAGILWLPRHAGWVWWGVFFYEGQRPQHELSDETAWSIAKPLRSKATFRLFDLIKILSPSQLNSR